MKKNLKYKNYFNNLEQILKKLNNKFLFYIPDLYKTDFRNEYIPHIIILVYIYIFLCRFKI